MGFTDALRQKNKIILRLRKINLRFLTKNVTFQIRFKFSQSIYHYIVHHRIPFTGQDVMTLSWTRSNSFKLH